MFERKSTLTWTLIKSDIYLKGNVLSWVIFDCKESFVLVCGKILDGEKDEEGSNLYKKKITIREAIVKTPPVAEVNYC